MHLFADELARSEPIRSEVDLGVEPDRVPDDLRREAMTIVGDALHPLTLPPNATTRSLLP
jgi:hypothetical protein